MAVLLFAIVVSFLVVIRIRRSCGRSGHVLDFAGPAAVLLICWPPVAWFIAWGLERSYPLHPYPPGDADAIVLLSGGIYPANASQPETAPGFTTYLRATHAAWLFHHWKPLPVIVTGGPTGGPGDLTVGGLMRRQLIEQGVPESMIIVENRAMSTYQNAVNTAQIVRERGFRRIALVTEAFHMRRSELCFRKQGIDVLPAPAAYRTLELTTWRDVLTPGIWAVRNNTECLHEWAGLAWYKLRGRI